MSGSKETEKQYGLINMKKVKSSSQPLQKKLAIFDESDEEETSQSAINQKLQQEAVKTKMRKQTKMEIQKAMEEDPTVFEYDSIYDDMEQKKQERERMIKSKQRDSKPKYIAGLMKAANQRKMERERQKERKIQKDREKEGEEFGDKEQFVTASYKKKMQELAEDEERERREAERDGDVTKNMDMTGFYRHILEQTTGGGLSEDKSKLEVKRESTPVVKPKQEEDGEDQRRHNIDNQDRDKSSEKDRGDSKQHKDTYRADDRRHREERHREDNRPRERDRTKDKDGGNKRDSERNYRKDIDREKDRKHRDNQGQDGDKDKKRDSGGNHDRDRAKYDIRGVGSHDKSPDMHKSTSVTEGKKYTGKERKEGEERLRIKDNEIQTSVGGEDGGQQRNTRDEDKGDGSGKKAEEVNEDADSDLDISEESEEESKEEDSEQEEKGKDSEQEEKGKDSDGEKTAKRVDKPTDEEKSKLKYSKRTTLDSVMSARDRYMARKMQRDAEKSHIAVEEDD